MIKRADVEQVIAPDLRQRASHHRSMISLAVLCVARANSSVRQALLETRRNLMALGASGGGVKCKDEGGRMNELAPARSNSDVRR